MFGVRVNGELTGTVDLRFSGEHFAPGEVNVAYGRYPRWRGRGFAPSGQLSEDGAVSDRYFLDLG